MESLNTSSSLPSAPSGGRFSMSAGVKVVSLWVPQGVRKATLEEETNVPERRGHWGKGPHTANSSHPQDPLRPFGPPPPTSLRSRGRKPVGTGPNAASGHLPQRRSAPGGGNRSRRSPPRTVEGVPGRGEGGLVSEKTAASEQQPAASKNAPSPASPDLPQRRCAPTGEETRHSAVSQQHEFRCHLRPTTHDREQCIARRLCAKPAYRSQTDRVGSICPSRDVPFRLERGS
jgi:hypothetical protein